MTISDCEVVALVGSRICHDLISPIGAIGNGVELLLTELAVQGPEMALISESVGGALARIRFFRLAMGAPDADQRISDAELAGVLQDRFRGSRLSIDLQLPGEIARWDSKLLCLMVMCLETALAHGGRIQISRIADRWRIEGSAETLRVDPDLWSCLVDTATDPAVGPAHVQFLLLPAELKRQHRRMISEVSDRTIRFSF